MLRKIKPADPVRPDPDLPARERLIFAGCTIFAQQGFAGASVREICGFAGTSTNMIHHYFGSKRGLYEEIISGFSERVLVVPIRIISEPARSRESLIARLEIFFAETLEALLAQPFLFRLIIREQFVFDVFADYNAQLVKFLESAKETGIIRAELDSEMLTGLLLDRLGNQILYAPWIKESTGRCIEDDDRYKNRWLKANMDLILHGILTR